MLDTSRLGAWADLPFFRTRLPGIEAALAADPRPWLPGPGRVFAALEATPPDAVRAVILGQDPYPTPGHANGLAFSVAPGVPLPRSLANIVAEVAADTGTRPADGDLSRWARQGVLLLNTVLTVPAGASAGHAALGWQDLADQVLSRLDDTPRAFLLWGAPAQRAARGLAHPAHLILRSSHPSPLSHRATATPFTGSRPFSRVNDWLTRRGEAPISWA
jgi:uracil-DNA glycosylase